MDPYILRGEEYNHTGSMTRMRIAVQQEIMLRQVAYQIKRGPGGVGFEHRQLKPEIFESIKNKYLQLKRDKKVELEKSHAIGTYIKRADKGKEIALHTLDRDYNDKLGKFFLPAMQQWAKIPIAKENIVYGFRTYKKSAWLGNHVDVPRSHVFGISLCIEDNTDEPWPLYIEGRDEKQYWINLTPGHFIIYESALLRHGRPIPLKGDSYTGIYFHYKPEGWGVTNELVNQHYHRMMNSMDDTCGKRRDDPRGYTKNRKKRINISVNNSDGKVQQKI